MIGLTRDLRRHHESAKRAKGLHFAIAVVGAALVGTGSAQGQSCAGNSNVGCTSPGAACTLSGAEKGRCATPTGSPKGERTCECSPPSAPPPPAYDIVTRPAPPTGIDAVVRIDKPYPKQAATEYPGITFQPGDTITIHAGGCVQGGGHGLTTRRYVDPIDSDERYYHGQISIPFATNLLTRIQNVLNQSVHISDTAPAGKLHLQLGYEDEKGAYGDNGYYSFDKGPGNQCAGSLGVPAWVQLDIKHRGPVTTPPVSGPWDLVISQFDDNGIALNPDWESHVATNKFPDPTSCRWPWQSGSSANCTSQITNTDYDPTAGYSFWKPWDDAECGSCSVCQSFSANYGYGGHANWMAATQTGTVFWEEKSSDPLDGEYSVNLDTPNALGATAGRPEGVHVEFDARETVDILADDLNISWWQQFRSAVNGGDEQAHQFLDYKDAIVTGLMGVDFAHSSTGPESHPAWAMAIHTNTDPSDDTWAFFVRSFGNEGYCSEQQHYISYLDNQYTFRLKWPMGATNPMISSSTVVLSNGATPSDLQVTLIPGQAVLLTLLNVPDQSVANGVAGGELHITWGGAPVQSVAARGAIPVNTPPEAYESLITSALSKMTPQQQAIYTASVPLATHAVRPAVRGSVKTVASQNIKSVAGRRPAVTAVRDPSLVARRNAYIQSLKKAYGGTLPMK